MSGPGTGISGVAAGRDVNVFVANRLRSPMLVLTFGSGASLVLFPEATTLVLVIVIVFGAIVVLPRVAAAQAAKVTTGSFPVFQSAGTTAALTLGALGAGSASGSAVVYVASEGRSLYSLAATTAGRAVHLAPQTVRVPATSTHQTVTMTVLVNDRTISATVVGLSRPEEYAIALYRVSHSYSYLGIVPLDVSRDSPDSRRATWSTVAPRSAERMLVHVLPKNTDIREELDVVNHVTPSGTVLTQMIKLVE